MAEATDRDALDGGAASGRPDEAQALSVQLGSLFDDVTDEFCAAVDSAPSRDAVGRRLCKAIVDRLGYREAWVLQMPTTPEDPAIAVASFGLTAGDIEAMLAAINNDRCAREAWEEAFRRDASVVRRLSRRAPGGALPGEDDEDCRWVGVFRLDLERPPRLALVLSSDADEHFSPESVSKLGQLATDAALAIERTTHRARLRRAHEERDQALQALTVLVDASPAAMLGVSPQGVIVSVNPAAEAMTGLEAGQMLGRNARDIVSPALASGVSRIIDAALAGEDLGTLEGPLWIRGGRRVWIRAAVAVERNAAGEVTGVVGVGLDATRERRLARTALRQDRLLERLHGQIVEAVGQERRAIAMGLHDELGQTLAALKLHLSMAISDSQCRTGDEHPVRAIELIDRAIAQTRSFTFELYPPILRELGLGAAIEWLAERIQKQEGGQWTFIGSDVDLSEDRASVLYGVTRELLRNVVTHACATDVLVTLATHAGRVSVAVYDNGKGFVDQKRSEGLGLFGVSVQLSRLGGELEIDTMPGGSTVRATIPIVAGNGREQGDR